MPIQFISHFCIKWEMAENHERQTPTNYNEEAKTSGQPLSDFLLQLEDYTPTVNISLYLFNNFLNLLIFYQIIRTSYNTTLSCVLYICHWNRTYTYCTKLVLYFMQCQRQVPDAISEHYLHTAGFNTTDPRMWVWDIIYAMFTKLRVIGNLVFF